ncbi:MAG: hypothetical protein HZC28_05450 [Spirochaetes bacterium]|nr:hypothetical protein [Spirochaetota bacterium]
MITCLKRALPCICTAALLVPAVPGWGYDVVWNQSLWRGGASPAAYTVTGAQPASNYAQADGGLFFTCAGYRTNGAVILKPVTNHWPSYVATATEFNSYGWSDWYQAPKSYKRYFDASDSVDGIGSAKFCFDSTNTGSINPHRNPNNKYKHGTITHQSNAFFMFFMKSQNPPGPPNNANLRLSVWILESSFGYKGHSVNGFSFADTAWNWNCGQFNFNTNNLRCVPNTNVDGWYYASNHIAIGLDVTSYFNRTGASPATPVSNTLWVDEPIFAYDLASYGSFVSCPIQAVPSFISNGTNYVFKNIKSIAFSGLQGMINTNGLGRSTFTNTNLNYYQEITAAMQLRSADTITALGSAPWTGPSGAGSSFTNTPGAVIVSNSPDLDNNARYFQYRVQLASSVQGTTPVVTNVRLIFEYAPAAVAYMTNPAPDIWITNVSYTFSGTMLPASDVQAYFSSDGITYGRTATNGSGGWWTNLPLSSLGGSVTLFLAASNAAIPEMITNIQTNFIDTTPPSSSITNVTAGQVVSNIFYDDHYSSNIFVFKGSNYDPESGVLSARVVISNAGGVAASVPAIVTETGWQAPWNSRAVPEGIYDAFVVSVNNAGMEYRSPGISFLIPYQPAAFSIKETIERATVINNPWRGGDRGVIFVNLTADTFIRIYTVAGKLISTIKPPPGGGGGSLTWNVRTMNGMNAGSGMYLCELVTPRRTRTMLVMVVRR